MWTFYFPLLGKHDALARFTNHIQIVTAPVATMTLGDLDGKSKFGEHQFIAIWKPVKPDARLRLSRTCDQQRDLRPVKASTE